MEERDEYASLETDRGLYLVDYSVRKRNRLDALALDAVDSGAGEIAASLCPVAGPVSFTNTWGAPRSSGRTHQGVDIFAAEGTPVVAPRAGEVGEVRPQRDEAGVALEAALVT